MSRVDYPPIRAHRSSQATEKRCEYCAGSEILLVALSPERSRTTWILEVGGKIFIPCGYMNSPVGRLWKHWPIEAQKDGRAILRVGDKKYERQLVRIQSGELLKPLTQEISRKYGVPATPEAVTSGSLWLFELTPRSSRTRAVPRNAHQNGARRTELH
jgi:hypothetical protein